MMDEAPLFARGDLSARTAPQPEPASFGDVPSRMREDGPSIATFSIPESFLTLSDARSNARWHFWAGVFAGAPGLGIILSLGAVLS